MVAFAEKISGGNETIFLDCYTGKPSFITKNYTINCYMYCGENYIIYYNDIYLGPYSYPLKVIEPFEVIISNFIKGKNAKIESQIEETENQTEYHYQNLFKIKNETTTEEKISFSYVIKNSLFYTFIYLLFVI